MMHQFQRSHGGAGKRLIRIHLEIWPLNGVYLCDCGLQVLMIITCNLQFVIGKDEVACECVCFTESTAVEQEIAIEVPQILPMSEGGPSSQPSDQVADEEMSTAVPQLLSADEAELPAQPLEDASLLDKKEGDEAEEEVEEEEEDEGEEAEEGKDDDAGDYGDDDKRDLKARMPAADEPDDQAGLVPEYTIAESVPDLPAVDG